MGERQRLVIVNLAQFGMVKEADSINLPPNAFQFVQNMGFYNGRVGRAARWGSLSTATPIFTGTTYATGALWKLYNSAALKIKAGAFAEYENASGTMYEIPCWLGLYSTLSTATFAGQALDGNWSTSTFPRAANKWLTTADKVFVANLDSPEFSKTFTDLGGGSGTEVALNTYADWTDSSSVIKQSDTTVHADCAYNDSTTEGLAFNSGAIASVANQFFTIRKIKLQKEGSKCALIVRDDTTHRGYALEVEETETPGDCYTFTVTSAHWQVPPATGDVYTRPNGTEFTVVGYQAVSGAYRIYTQGTGDPALNPASNFNTIVRKEGYSGGQGYYVVTPSVITTGPFTVSIRLWDGYFDSGNTEVGTNAAVVWEKTGITDWGYSSYNDVYYEDLWMWWRDSFITFGYGPNAQGCVTISATPEDPRIGFSLNNAYINKAGTGKYCIYSFDVGTNKTGPYTISALTSTHVTVTSPPGAGTDFLIWACKHGSRTKTVCGSDYLLFKNVPVTIWRGGMTEEVPLTNPKMSANFSYYANDIAIFKGRVLLGGIFKVILKYEKTLGYYDWVAGLNTPTVVKWSSAYHPDVWDDNYPSGTTADVYYLAGFIDFAETNGPVNALAPLRDVLMVYKSDAIAMLSPTGIALDPFQVDYLANTTGVQKPGTGDTPPLGVSPSEHYFATPNQLWKVELGEVSKVPMRTSLQWVSKIWMLPSENTVFINSGVTDTGYTLVLAYNWMNNAAYYFWTNLVDLQENYNYVYGLHSNGKYVYQALEQRDVPTSYMPGIATYPYQLVTCHLSMDDLVNDKTIYNVDVFTRHRGTSSQSTANLKVRIGYNNTLESSYTDVAGEKVGQKGPTLLSAINNETDEWRFRYNRVQQALTFQVDLQLDTTASTGTADHEISRIEIDFETMGPSKKA